jgi:hypothetical protein
MAGRRRHLALAGDDQTFGDQRADVITRLAGAWDVQSFEQRAVAHHIGRLAVRDLPHDLTRVQADRRDGRIRRFDHRETLDVQGAVATSASASGASGSCVPRRQRRIGAGVFARAGPHAHFLTGGPLDVVDIRESFRRTNQADRSQAGVACVRVHDVGLGIV